ncbi:MAG: PEP-CTERM sorting domain-containing protein [Phycisphaeraceae bacterium]
MNVSKRWNAAWMVAGALVVGLAATSAKASTVTNLDDIMLGDQVSGPSTQPLYSVNLPDFPQTQIGSITSRVFENDGLYTYTYRVDPDINFFSEFSTGFAPLEFNGVKGWDFSDVPGNFFDVEVDPDGTIDWMVQDPEFIVLNDVPNGDLENLWTDQNVTFFYQSTMTPGTYDVFNVTNGRSGSGLGIVPVPEPASASLLGLLGMAMLRRRSRRTAA